MYNEFIFIFHIIFISLILMTIIHKNNEYILYIVSSIFLIVINLSVNKTISLWGITTTTVEPYTVALFWIGIYCYRIYGKRGQKNISLTFAVTSILFIFSTIWCMLYYEINENYLSNAYNIIINKTNYSILLSACTFYIAYYSERRIFDLFKKHISEINAQTVSACISQFIDTILYSFLFFSFFELQTKIQIIFFAVLIKIICIMSYRIFCHK
jgi:uncharacterized integral membrane protein (TIGR00697 family)